MSIKFLSLELSKYIAAGEVIHRPFSVVKELIENSLDANATFIKIEIKHGGKKTIRVQDNGEGINKNELLIALERYTSSKIHILEDLKKIKTFGFRGEALASINAVSKISLISRTSKDNVGWQIYAEGGKISNILKPIAHPIGTTIEISDLFYNIPIKKNLLKSERTEFLYINDVIKQIALSKFSTDILLINNNKIIQKHKIALNIKEKENRINNILGEKFSNKKTKIKYKHKNVKITGWICLEHINKKIEYSYVNNRLIKNKIIKNIITQIQKKILNSNKKISYIIFIKINTKDIDINIHPSKCKINFKNPLIIYYTIYNAIKNKIKLKINKKYIYKNKNKIQKINLNNKIKIEKILINKSLIKKTSKNKNKIQKIKLLTKINKNHVIIKYKTKIFLINLINLIKVLQIKQLNLINQKKIRRLIIPIRLKIKKYKKYKKYEKLLKKIGINLYKNNKNIVIYTTPLIITGKYENFCIKLLQFINTQKNINLKKILSWLKYSIIKIQKYFDHKKIVKTLIILERFNKLIKNNKTKIKFIQIINIKKYINKIKNKI
ncbi:DNA mismatch repair endonuclease MutL [Candidatus Purcelliella pentastirinorum]|uniref:DNA mismatch repair protein MutL n=1 Tax=Candidatus Purcelliella pentastirinorum TaxID=472834 RepID=A0AAX3N7I3_9ENTR|nr:DNA mismatch repair endonuclease MutL [Candidatus Purcelliella pentastirinorum]WDI78512.1 DNA mismatch repair endonuclease MutL [Candidatus Purcelliella pentastirinorum]WDR80459.1 DNA mismatch repair endonuclease MutL [Candidatus Purcelliella pentastirinorum]